MAMDNLGLRLIIFLTTQDPAARWRALINLNVTSRGHVLLRMGGCCYDCIVRQALVRSGRWLIVL